MLVLPSIIIEFTIYYDASQVGYEYVLIKYRQFITFAFETKKDEQNYPKHDKDRSERRSPWML